MVSDDVKLRACACKLWRPASEHDLLPLHIPNPRQSDLHPRNPRSRRTWPRSLRLGMQSTATLLKFKETQSRFILSCPSYVRLSSQITLGNKRLVRFHAPGDSADPVSRQRDWTYSAKSYSAVWSHPFPTPLSHFRIQKPVSFLASKL